MSWGKHLSNISEDKQLLYWALLWAMSPMGNRPVDYFLTKILGSEGRAAADPGWEIEKLTNEEGQEEFYIWLDPDIYLMEPNEGTFSREIFRLAVKETLSEYAKAYPENSVGAQEVRIRYGLE
jgi:hypothetical protein